MHLIMAEVLGQSQDVVEKNTCHLNETLGAHKWSENEKKEPKHWNGYQQNWCPSLFLCDALDL